MVDDWWQCLQLSRSRDMEWRNGGDMGVQGRLRLDRGKVVA